MSTGGSGSAQRIEDYALIGNKRLLGNFPQAFSHVGLVNTAHNLALHKRPANQRAAR